MESFTVLMPIYNRQDLCFLFKKAIESCLSNTVIPDKILIVADGPLNNEFESIVRSYEKNEIIEVLWLDKNCGLTKALNEGLKRINTRYVFRADGDDINRPERFEKQLEMLKDGNHLIGSCIAERDIDGKVLAIKSCPTSHEEIINFAKRRNPFNHMTVAFELDAIKRVGGYPDVYLKEDWALWALMIESGVKTENSPEILVDATADINMYARRGGLRTILSEMKMQKLLIDHLNKSILISIIDFFSKAFILALPARVRGYIYREFLREKP